MVNVGNADAIHEVMLIAGASSEAREKLAVHNPARLSEVVGWVPRGSAADAERAIRAADEAFPAWSGMQLGERAAALRAAAIELNEADQKTTAVLLVRESGKTLAEARGEVSAAINCLFYYAELAETFELAEELPSPSGRVTLVRESIGVTSIIVPWNAPLLLSSLAFAPALIAGNTVIVKPSSEAPLALVRFLRIIAAHLPAGVLNAITGVGPDLGHILSTHPAIRRVMFTGSTEVGRDVATAAMASFKRVSMELGGNDPAVILSDAIVDDDLVSQIRASVYAMSGQVCYAIKRIYVHESLHHEFVERFTAASDALVVGDGLDPRTTCGPLINARQVRQVQELIRDARSGGAKTSVVGSPLDPDAWDDGCFQLPTVISNVSPECAIVTCEQFGPVIPIMAFRSEDEAITMANATEFGLASSIWTADEARAFSLARRLQAGTTFVNTHRAGAAGIDMPFGGVKHSGIGRTHGTVALEEQFELHTISSRP